MKPAGWLCSLFLLLTMLASGANGCSKEACEEAYDKAQECVSNLNCKHLDPMQQPQCEQSRRVLQEQNETLFKIACDEAEAQKYIDCQLDPTTCRCPGQ